MTQISQMTPLAALPASNALVPVVSGGSNYAFDITAIAGFSATRAALAQAATSTPRFLTESGREGTFVFDTANHATDVAADPNQYLYVAPSSDPTGASGAWVRKPNNREKILADRTYYVRNDGADSNSGLANSASGAFLTLQQAVNTVFNRIDLNGHNITIQAEDGTRTAGFLIDSPQTGNGMIFILGNVTTPDNCPVNVTGTDAFKVSNGATIWLRGFKVTTTTSGAGVVAYNNATINMQAMDFGACAASHIECGQGSNISLDGAYTISGSAVSHWHVGSFGLISAGTFTVTITGTPNFSSYFAGVAQGDIVATGVTFSGSATGQRYLAHHGGLIRAAGIDPALPGNVEGVANAGGIYIASVVNPWVIAPDSVLNNSVSIRGHNTGTNAQVERFVTRTDANASANFYCNGDNSYSSGETWFGNTQRTQAGTGTQLGATFYSQSALASSFPVFEAAASGAPVAYMSRRTSDGAILSFLRDTTSVGSFNVSSTSGLTYVTSSSSFPHTFVVNASTIATISNSGVTSAGSLLSSGTSGLGYTTGAGGTVTQTTSRTTAVTINKPCGRITLVSAAGSATYSTFTVNNSVVASTDTVEVSQASGTNIYNILVNNVSNGSFQVSVSAVSGTATEAPVINFTVTKSVTA